MSSFALWFDSDVICDSKINAEVHFNLWNLHYKKALPPSLDVGIKIAGMKNYSAVNFFIPFFVEKKEVKDIGKILCSSEILCSVFNEDYMLSHQGNDKKLLVNDLSGKKIMAIYCLDEHSDISVINKYNGSIITILVPESLRSIEETIYIRFRIQSKGFYKVIKTYNPQNLLLQSAVSVVEAIDFRFNDYKSLNPSLLEQMRRGISYNIRKVHFLLLTEADVDITFSSSVAMARELETDIWNGYFDSISERNIVAYHWKFKSDDCNKLIENCIMFVKTKIHKCNWVTIGLYLLFLRNH